MTEFLFILGVIAGIGVAAFAFAVVVEIAYQFLVRRGQP